MKIIPVLYNLLGYPSTTITNTKPYTPPEVTSQKKIYANYDNYYGTIHFKVLKSTHLLYKIQGLIGGLFESTIVKNMMKPA